MLDLILEPHNMRKATGLTYTGNIPLDVVFDEQSGNSGKRVYIQNDTPVREFLDEKRRNRRKDAFSEGNILTDEVLDKFKKNRRKGVYIKIMGKREIKFDVEKHLKIGMEVAIGRIRFGRNKYMYKHHGIIIKICKIKEFFEIVSLSAEGIFAAVAGRNLEPKIETTRIMFNTKDLFFYDYSSFSFGNTTIRKRVKMLISLFARSGLKYNLRKFNCEHFASYCATGLAFSRQVSHVNWEATIALDKQ
ncbi:unnamed protein product [Mytilus coruscus]|uniref:LRAT domain-containing protein n=1 Tax=Mytilus coruscus TaxID=42192 RepID=A0A6J8AGJ2_MYTCO|nr:unnamed protein product [Mytilus coruscus]